MSLRNTTGQLVPCSWCALSIPKNDQSNHSKYCTGAVDCEYEAYGCKQRVRIRSETLAHFPKIPRKEYEAHLRENSQFHLSLISGVINKTGPTPTPSAPPLDFVDLVSPTVISPSVPLQPSPIVNNINYRTAFNTLANQFSQMFAQPSSNQGADIVKQLLEVFQNLYKEFMSMFVF